MTAAAIPLGGNLKGRSARHASRARTGTDRGSAPVRRGSASSDDVDRHTRFMSLGDRRHLFRVVEAWNKAQRKHGVAPLTPSTLHGLEVMLFQLMDRRTGRLDPAYTWIAHCARRAYQTAVDAVAQLEAAGILKVQRRCRRGEDGGPDWVQDTNLYRVELPEKIAGWYTAAKGHWERRRRARHPADDVSRRKAAQAATTAQEQDLWAWRGGDELEAAAQRRKAQASAVQGPGAAAYRARVEDSA